MLTNSNDFPVSDELERRLVRQIPRNRQIPHQRNCGPTIAKRLALALLGLVQTLLKTVFQTKSGTDSSASRNPLN